MSDRIQLFKPEDQGLFKKSPVYALSLFGGIMSIAISYLARSMTKHTDRLATDEYVNKFWHQQLQSTFSSLFVTGREYLLPGETYVFMSNHESWMDIPAMFAAVPTSLRMVSKAEIMRLPIIGPAMVNAGFIAVDRGNRKKSIKQLEIAKERLAQGISMWIAPEGTRSRDGSLLNFKKGGFHVARSLGKAIVPVYIEGARDVLAPDSVMVNTNKSITVHFCPPIETLNYEKSHNDKLIELVRSAIVTKKNQVLGEKTKDEAL